MMTSPLYRQIADDLRRRIEGGELREGVQVPTEDQLMLAYHASRNTVRGALKELATRGLVHTLHGKGTFVSERISPIVTTLTGDPKTGLGGGEGLVYTAEVAASGRSPNSSEPRVEIRKASPAVARFLRVPVGTEVIIRHQKRYVDKSAVVPADVLLPETFVRQRSAIARYRNCCPGNCGLHGRMRNSSGWISRCDSVASA